MNELVIELGQIQPSDTSKINEIKEKYEKLEKNKDLKGLSQVLWHFYFKSFYNSEDEEDKKKFELLKLQVSSKIFNAIEIIK